MPSRLPSSSPSSLLLAELGCTGLGRNTPNGGEKWGESGLEQKRYKSHIPDKREATSIRLHLLSKSPCYQPSHPTGSLSTFSMQPSSRKTRSHTSPGVVDLPKSRRSSADVAADKAESKKIALANAKKMRERAAQVARVENEIRNAQKEAAYPQEEVRRGESRRPSHARTSSRIQRLVYSFFS